MSYSLTIFDETTSKKWSLLNVPLIEERRNNIKQVETKSGAVHTYFINQKRVWSHSWSYMTSEEYDELLGFYQKQFEGRYPRVTIEGLENVVGVPVYIELSKKNIISDRGWVSGVDLVMREAE